MKRHPHRRKRHGYPVFVVEWKDPQSPVSFFRHWRPFSVFMTKRIAKAVIASEQEYSDPDSQWRVVKR